VIKEEICQSSHELVILKIHHKKKKNLDLFIKIKINCGIFHEINIETNTETHNKAFIFSTDTEQRLK